MKQIFFSIIALALLAFSQNLHAVDYTECVVLDNDDSGSNTFRETVDNEYNIGPYADCPPTYSTIDVEFDQVILFASPELDFATDINEVKVLNSPVEFDNSYYNVVVGNWAVEALNDVTTSFVYTEDEIAGIDTNWGSVVIDATDLDEGELPFTCTEGTKVYIRNLFINTNKVYTFDDFGDCGMNVGYSHICGGEIYKTDPWNYVDSEFYSSQDYYNSIKNSLWTPEEEEEEETGTTSGGSTARVKSGMSKAKSGSVFDIATYNIINQATSVVHFSASNTSNPDTQITYGPNVAGWCDQDADGDGYKTYNTGDTDNQDCNDWESSIYPGATEYCDGIDNDCDGQIDEEGSNDATTWYKDSDGDDYGDPNDSKTSCSEEVSGYVENNDDCDDNNDDLNPGATEVCDGVDNDCDGEIDEDLTSTTSYYDADEDGYGNSDMFFTDCTEVPEGYVLTGGDCDETDPSINPSATEICAEEDTVDEDCNDDMGCEDSACASEAYCESVVTPEPEVDADGDGYTEDEDCDDTNPDINPGMSEVCGNGEDDDCDGQEDEGNTYYFDSDGDGYGDINTTEVACEPSDGFVENSDDCNDLDGGVSPDATEDCTNDVDDNCDGLVDEEDTIVCPQQTEIENPDVNDDWAAEVRGGSGACQINQEASFNLTALFFILISILTLQVARRGKRV